MLRSLGVLAVLAAACGRIAFDAAGDALDDHDEDGDGLTDDNDRCPHVADVTNADGDGDLVGDACDPEPAVARQHWTLFSAMTGSLPFSAGPTGAWTMNADDWQFADLGLPSQLIRTGMVGDVDIWVGFDIEALGTGGRQAAIIINGTNVPYYYGELYEAGSGARISIAEYDGTNYLARTQNPVAPAFPLGANELYVSARLGASVRLRSTGLETSYATPQYAGDRFVIFAFGNLTGRVRYLAIVESQ